MGDMAISGQTDNLNAAVIVAHPDDETLWAGGTILMHQHWRWNIIALCRASDIDRAPRFRRALQELGASGNIGDLDDSREQTPLPEQEVRQTIIKLLTATDYDLVVTHSPFGEYTRHRRHEETGRAVASLWKDEKIRAKEVWMFAYEDGGKKYFPRAIGSAHLSLRLPDAVWQQKYRIITALYGFEADSYEAQTTPVEEAFWRFNSVKEFQNWINGKGA
jgi:LmbE family N-acetylglucosaminyl deacetylase